jgi:hypothetical protein
MNGKVGIFIGIIGMVIGGWLLYSVIKNKLPSELQSGWLPKDYAGRESLERFLGIIVGAGFVIVGFLMFISSLLQLFS